MLGLFFDIEDGGNMFLRHVGFQQTTHGVISHKMEHFFKNEMVRMATGAAWIPLTAKEGISRVNNGS
jgi:hypothetical protein